jgi:imidazoleglycerol phosphate synthase cyclase subunit
VIGNPISTVERFSHWNVDELIILDISDTDYHDLRRDDLYQNYAGSSPVDVLKEISKVCFMPLAFGGRIRNLEDIQLRLAAGADKVVINTKAYNDPNFISQAAKRFGTQCIIVSIDVFENSYGRYEVYVENGKQPTGLDPVEWAKQVEHLDAGEIFLNSINRDGTGLGYDLELIRRVTDQVTIPVIACGGVGQYADLPGGILEGSASAVSAANIFHFFELSYPFGNQACVDVGIPMREVKLGSTWFERTPKYDYTKRDKKISNRLADSRICFSDLEKCKEEYINKNFTTRWCARCVYPSISAAHTYAILIKLHWCCRN